jgi:hypothetical protein
MTLADFQQSVTHADPPPTLSPELRALWHDARGDWHAAHETVQDSAGAAAAWVHAYLHRKEGDEGNARYWYQRARQPVFTGSLDAEWAHIAGALLDASREPPPDA